MSQQDRKTVYPSIANDSPSLTDIPDQIYEFFLGEAATATPSSSDKKPEPLKSLFSSFLLSWRKSRYLIIVAAFVAGFGLGRAGNSSALFNESTRRIAAADIRRLSARTWILSTLLAGALLREVWRSIPAWLQRQLVPWRRRSSARSVGKDDMTSVATLWSKLQSLFQLASDKLLIPSATRNEKLETTMLVFLRLLRQVQQYRPDIRNRSFPNLGEAGTLPKGLDKTFELADLAYNELPEEATLRDALQDLGYDLLRHDAINLPGSVAHYVALDRSAKVAVIGVKGTSSFEDLLTDCCGLAVSEVLTNPIAEGGPTEIRCHDGILTASKRLFHELLPLVQDLLLPCNFRIVLTGHSLGAGAAALVGILLRTHLSLTKEELEVVAFASPPILDSQAAMACRSFVTTVVNKADVIPRASLANLAVLRSLLTETIRPRMEQRGLVPQDFNSTRALVQYLFRDDDDEKEDSWIVGPGEIEMVLASAMETVSIEDPDHLYIPGRVLLMYSMWKLRGSSDETREDEKDAKNVEGVTEILPTDRVLRFFEIELSMITDHLAPGYRSSISTLIEMDLP